MSVHRIKALALDVDGVLTDGGFLLGEHGEVHKRLSFRDVMGVFLARERGLGFVLITGEGGPLLDALARKLGIDEVRGHCRDKAGALRAYAQERGLPLEAICFLGDDVNDLPAMAIAGQSAAPSDAHPAVLAQVTRVLSRPGGQGALREWLDLWMAEPAAEAPAAGVIWITGLSGAGKTTLAQAVRERLSPRCPGGVVVLDGDALRQACGGDLGHARADRVVQIGRMQRFARLLAEQGVLVIAAALYADRELLEWNRNNLPGYLEVYIKAGLPALRQRDYKGVYQCTEHVVGVDIPWTEPWAPDLVLDGDHPAEVGVWAGAVVSAWARR
jgi:YrbI family 3-deoxy-D-manno-octulosonate 8-phosphate phosphatase